MRTVVIGNSIVRGLRDPSWETISIPGADWYDIIDILIQRRYEFRNAIIYIHIGPVRFTRLERLGSRRECRLRPYRELSNIEGIFERWKQYLTPLNIHPVLCTIYPIDFCEYNRNIGGLVSSHRRNLYSRDSQTIRSMTVIENRGIVDFNVYNNFITPYMHRRIFTRRRGRYVFRNNLLRDGLHPSDEVIDDWIREIRRVHRDNRDHV